MDKLGHYKPTDKMSALINANPLLIMAMSRFGISLGFGDATVQQICDDQGVDCPTFLAVANFISFGSIDTANVDLSSLMYYLEHAHTYFLDFNLPLIRRKLIEAIDCSGRDELAMLILKFYDEYVDEVSRHMHFEDATVFKYVKSMLQGQLDGNYSVSAFASGHHSIHSKLKELKDIIIRYLPQKENNLLNAVLFDIINCEQDLIAHCLVEDKLFVPVALKTEAELESRPRTEPAVEANDNYSTPLSLREREIIACVAKGMSNKEIAEALSISVNTVTTHRRNLAQKLQIHSPAALAIYAVLNKIIDIDSLK
ncbi:MAG: helix-turn-helix transcriptional regulator [Clostridium sp.]|nr:helix-turn-helix transcriptional regulator [Clostridium sp.]